MLILLALPVIITVTAVHRYLVLYAPTNLLVRHVRGDVPLGGVTAGVALRGFAGLV